MVDFKGFPKIHRLNREVIITEKIDGTNGVIYIDENNFLVGNRSRWITPDNDNYGFAKWACLHKNELLKLGKGYHYGEWWGNGINRGYGLPRGDKRFSLFNVSRWKNNPDLPNCVFIVPVLYQAIPVKEDGTTCLSEVINNCLTLLYLKESQAVPFMNPEGIVVYWPHINFSFKITLNNDQEYKENKNAEI